MQKLFELIQKDPAFKHIIATFAAEKQQTLIYGLSGSQKAFAIALAFQQAPRPTVVITANRETLQQLQNDFLTILPGTPVWEFVPGDIITFTTAASSIELTAKRLDVLSRMAKGYPAVFLVTAEAAMQKVLPKQQFINNRLTLTLGATLALDELLKTLLSFGYERVDQVDGLGQFSVRGGIIDIFPVNRELPLRLELFGDEIDSLREFDLTTQRPLASVTEADVLPLAAAQYGNKTAAL